MKNKFNLIQNFMILKKIDLITQGKEGMENSPAKKNDNNNETKGVGEKRRE